MASKNAMNEYIFCKYHPEESRLFLLLLLSLLVVYSSYKANFKRMFIIPRNSSIFFWFPSVSSWSSFFPKFFYCYTFISVIRYFHSGFSVSYEMKNEWNIINNDSKRVQNPGCLYFSIFLLLHYIYANWIWKKFFIQFTCQSITGKKITNEKRKNWRNLWRIIDTEFAQCSFHCQWSIQLTGTHINLTLTTTTTTKKKKTMATTSTFFSIIFIIIFVSLGTYILSIY